jgi:DNA mismatch endonuclease (patch repair protein)
MVDRLTKEHRSWNMSRIRATNTSPEIKVRSLLHRMGFRFRLHSRKLPGKPDIVLPRLKTVIFVHGCFWHRHAGCRFAYTPKSRHEFWRKKFESNQARDREVRKLIGRAGWRVIVVWECQLSKPNLLQRRLNRLLLKVVENARYS